MPPEHCVLFDLHSSVPLFISDLNHSVSIFSSPFSFSVLSVPFLNPVSIPKRLCVSTHRPKIFRLFLHTYSI